MAPRILVVRFSSIGDILLTTPLLRAIKRTHPDSHVTFLTRADMADAIRGNPHVDAVVAWPRNGSMIALARLLRAQRFTDRLDLHRSLRSRVLRWLVPGRWTSYPKHRIRRRLLIATHRALGGHLGHVADRYFVAARGLGVRPDAKGIEFSPSAPAVPDVDNFLRTHQLGGERPLAVLAPGAAHFTKRWPLRHWRALANQLAATHDIVVVGGGAERDDAEQVVTAAGSHAASAAGLFSLDGTAALLQRSSWTIAGDTGVLHLATAFGGRITGLYGPTVEEFGFFPYHATVTPVQRAMDCRPCSSQGGPACPLGHHHCLELISAEEVLAAR